MHVYYLYITLFMNDFCWITHSHMTVDNCWCVQYQQPSKKYCLSQTTSVLLLRRCDINIVILDNLSEFVLIFTYNAYTGILCLSFNDKIYKNQQQLLYLLKQIETIVVQITFNYVLFHAHAKLLPLLMLVLHESSTRGL